MEYLVSLEQARVFARSSLALIEEKGLTPNPDNFALWFQYFAGNPDLRRALDLLLDSEEAVTDEGSRAVFKRFFPSDDDHAVLSEAALKVEEELAGLLEHLGIAESGAADYGRTLESVSGQLSGSKGPPDLTAMITGTLAATRAMQERNRELEDKLNDSSSEISKLREDLEFMRREATTDALTGIANRKLFDAELRRFTLDATNENEELCLLMIDIDHFKNFNDTYGHQIGDQVLKLLALTLTETIKGQDTAARYGGEEFAVILPRTALSNAMRVAEDIRRRVGSRRVRNRATGQTLGQINVSIGVGMFAHGEPLGQLIARADRALYMAKHTGRNRVVSEQELSDLDDGSAETRPTPDA